MTQQWFVRRDKKTHGPFSTGQIRKLAAEGRLRPEFLISNDQKKWVQASKVHGLTFGGDPGSVDSNAATESKESKPSSTGATVASASPSESMLGRLRKSELATPGAIVSVLILVMVVSAATMYKEVRMVVPLVAVPIVLLVRLWLGQMGVSRGIAVVVGGFTTSQCVFLLWDIGALTNLGGWSESSAAVIVPMLLFGPIPLAWGFTKNSD